MTNAMLEKLVRFQRPERVLPYARLGTPTLAGIFGTDEPEYLRHLADLDRRRDEAAARIAADTFVRALPFEPGAHLVAIGESTTADRLSWFEILRVVLERHRPDLRFTNLAVSGATTTQTLAMLPAIRRLAPTWVFCMLGANDSQRFDAPDGPLLVSPDETRRNLTELRRRAVQDNDASWVWVTPTPVDEERIARYPFFGGAGISWSNEDLDEVARALPADGDLVIDSAKALAGAGPDALGDDGVHPSAAAQEALAAWVLEALAAKETR